MADYSINIIHMFPDLLNLYGDNGNIRCLTKRLNWRGIDANVTACTNANDDVDFSKCDIVFLGGGSDREQEIVCEKLLKKQSELKAYVEDGGTLVAVCGGYQLLGSYYQTNEKKIEGLSLLNLQTDQVPGAKRLIGNVVLKSDLISDYIVGFENHAGRTQINEHTPLGKVEFGFGNNGKTGYEGAIYKNVIGTYLHGPLLPKNPQLCDLILTKALSRKYGSFTELSALDDKLEKTANKYIVDRFLDENK